MDIEADPKQNEENTNATPTIIDFPDIQVS